MTNKRKPLTPERVAQLRANAGTRAALPDKYLTPQQRAQRALNQRLDQTVTPGSSLTYRQLAHQRQASLDTQFGPQEQALGQQLSSQQQLNRDLQSGFDAYLADLRSHAQNTGNIVGAANQANQQLVGSIGNLRTDVGGSPAQGDADQAAAVRQKLLASFGVQQAGAGQANQTYADTLANVVGPGQKLQSIAQGGRNEQAIRGKLTGLAAQRGAAGQQYDADTIAAEAKNVLANAAFGLDQARADASAAAGRATRRETRRHNQAMEDKPSTGYGPGAPGLNKYGYSYDEWNALSAGQRNKARAGKDSRKGDGRDWLTQSEMSAGLSQLADFKSYATKAKTGQPFVAGHKPQPRASRSQAAEKIQANLEAPKDPILLTATLDAVYDGHLSAKTIKALINAGYKPSRVALALGVPTSQQYRNRTPGQIASDALTTVRRSLPGGGG